MRRLLPMLALLALARPAVAQISPGELSQAHARLEGSGSCLKCHEPSKGVAADRCLACHTALAQRIAADRGLHARPEYAHCEKCHVEHGGRSADIVWWGKAGRQAFDHRTVGYVLEGKHATLACDACHQAKNVQHADVLAKGGVGARTFLGLGTVCTACHVDVHRAQFEAADCRSCHSLDAWRPAARFDHARARYPLTGKHAAVACDKCHAAVADAAGQSFRRYRGVAFQACTSCHDDVHRGRLGAACTTCHTTAGWKEVTRGSFDHEKTAYPLRGRHATVACEKCHVPGRPMALKHDRCTDCHGDAHRGEFAQRADQGRCEACHEVDGFSPARYSIEDHQKTRYPLAGAHLAVACDACHRRAPGQKTAGYRLSFARCTDCHKDPHKGEVDRLVQKSGCESCHGLDSWRRVTTFDHATTRFPLEAGHAKPACSACHKKVDAGTPRERIQFTGLPLACAQCHADPHAAQFATAGTTRCERCHAADGWRKLRFDHNRDAAYHLDGAHARVACSGCHRTETREGRSVVRYKPLKSECRDCHASGAKP